MSAAWPHPAVNRRRTASVFVDAPRAAAQWLWARWAQLLVRWRQPALIGLSLVGVAVLVLFALNLDRIGWDAHAYWLLDLADPYARSQGTITGIDGFYYSPVFAFAFAPFGALPWPVFIAAWITVMLAVLAWVGGRWFLALVAIYPITLELAYGNIYLLLAAALVLGMRYPALWAVFPLTKVTPGIVWLWFVARGEWRNLAVAASTTAALAAVCYLVAPGMWADWIMMLGGNVGAPTHDLLPVPLVVRLPLAALLIVWGARTDRAWVLPIALLLSLPTFWTTSLTVLVACVPLAWPASRWNQATRQIGGPIRT